MTLAAAEKTIAMPIAKPCFGLGFKEEPLPFGDLRSEMLYELILCCICGGMSPLYRRLYDEGLTNPGFGGEVLRVDGCCCILFTGESDQPDTVRQLLLDEIERVRKEGVDREIFTLCKNEKYGQLIEKSGKRRGFGQPDGRFRAGRPDCGPADHHAGGPDGRGRRRGIAAHPAA